MRIAIITEVGRVKIINYITVDVVNWPQYHGSVVEV